MLRSNLLSTRLRSLMKLVVVIAFTIWGTMYVIEQRHIKNQKIFNYSLAASRHATDADLARIGAQYPLSDEEKVYYEQLETYHKQLEQKYLTAAKNPRIPVPPDPPEPKQPVLKINLLGN